MWYEACLKFLNCVNPCPINLGTLRLNCHSRSRPLEHILVDRVISSISQGLKVKSLVKLHNS